MTRSKRLRPIIDLATHREKEASIEMSEIQARLEQHQELLAQLETYHAQYGRSTTLRNADPVRLQDFRLFMDRLEHAITRQRDIVARVRSELEIGREHWSDRRRQRKALDNAATRYQRAEALAADQDEQRQIEEIAALLRTRSV